MIYFCAQKNRRALVLQQPGLNGIDYLEVAGDGAADDGCGKTLLLTLLKDARAASLTPSQVRITGGTANAAMTVTGVQPGTAEAPRIVTVTLSESGGFSPYTLRLVATPATDDPPDGFDPALSAIGFSFKAGCPTAADCLPSVCCPPAPAAEPDINYLAKDYDGFRQVMLDRMTALTPGWAETHAADLGIALVEVLAYAADHLSYRQDAAGTEAYLGTARSRISLRRHVRLVDYRIGEGANARAWIHVSAAAGGVLLPAGTRIFPRVPGLPVSVAPETALAGTLLKGSALAFATMQDLWVYPEQNEMQFYTWSDMNCCLAPGVMEATLAGTLTSLQPGGVLIFEEVKGPATGDPDDADPAKRWAVRLTSVRCTDYKNRVLTDPLNGQAITRVVWSAADSPPFPLCLSSTSDASHGSRAVFGVSVARGNIVPADHGVWQAAEDLGQVPAAPPAPVLETSCACATPALAAVSPPRYRPRLAQSPLTFARPLAPAAPASTFLTDPSRPAPQLSIEDDQGQAWTVLEDLLSSGALQRVCAVEIERDGAAFVRFGDGAYGAAPETGVSFSALYRVGNGTAGNVGRDTLAHVLTAVAGITEVRNPLAASGGVDPETMEHIRQFAPSAFRTQLRAVTEDDYGTMAALDPAIREARGTLRWTGSWYTAFVSLDAASGDSPSPALVAATARRLDLLRMAGVDLQVEGAIIVGLRIEMEICVDPGHFRGDVQAALRRLFTAGNLCDGSRGVLDAGRFTFGQTIYTSVLVAAAQGVEGVASATVTAFQRMDDPSIDGAALGFLTMGRLELARCDNDPGRLDHGIFVAHMEGGK